MSGNVKIVKTNVKEVLASMSGNRLGQLAMAGAFILEGAVKISIAATSHTGRRYGKHQASAPGETPAVETSNLVNSISTELESSSETNAIAQVGTGVDYAEPLEMGTSTIAARPFMRPAYDNNVEIIKDTIRKMAQQNIEGAAK